MDDKSSAFDKGPATSGLNTRAIAAALVGVALVLFVLQNSQDARVKWLFIDTKAPLWLVIVVTAVFAILMERLVLWLWHRRSRDD